MSKPMTARPMTEKLEPCPFCGDSLVIVNGGDANPRLAQHPMDPRDGVHCPISWLSLPSHRFEMWNRRSTSASERGMREALERMGFGSLRDDELVGWRGHSASSNDLFQCEFCRREHRDSTLIEHEANCPVLLARAALTSKGKDEQATRPEDGPTAPTDRL